jgi:hypothetical protein
MKLRSSLKHNSKYCCRTSMKLAAAIRFVVLLEISLYDTSSYDKMHHQTQVAYRD